MQQIIRPTGLLDPKIEVRPTKLTSGKSSPSLNKLIPTNTSYLPKRRSLNISVLSNVGNDS